MHPALQCSDHLATLEEEQGKSVQFCFPRAALWDIKEYFVPGLSKITHFTKVSNHTFASRLPVDLTCKASRNVSTTGPSPTFERQTLSPLQILETIETLGRARAGYWLHHIPVYPWHAFAKDCNRKRSLALFPSALNSPVHPHKQKGSRSLFPHHHTEKRLKLP